jgi:hypothetical protein
MAARILPPQEYLRECLDYDPKTGVLIWKRRPIEHFKSVATYRSWNKQFPGVITGCPTNYGRVLTVCLDRVLYGAHRLIWCLITGNQSPEHIDHKDRNPQHNAWNNLREATRSQNMANSKQQSNNTVGWKGVKISRNGKFEARITSNSTTYHHLGTFDTPEEAHAAYCKAARELHGEFWNPG